jgi:hypothetical protein
MPYFPIGTPDTVAVVETDPEEDFVTLTESLVPMVAIIRSISALPPRVPV